METDTQKQRQHFCRDDASGQGSMSEWCDRYQISRPTGYKVVYYNTLLGRIDLQTGKITGSENV